jgi:hypothetical protein
MGIGGMRCFSSNLCLPMRWFFMLVISAPTATAVLAQDTTDTLMRAAYCAGVLKESVKRAQQIAADAQAETHTCPSYSAESHQLPLSALKDGDCVTRMVLSIRVGRIAAEQYEARRQRYAQYLLLRLSDMSHGQTTAVMALTLKGERDAVEQLKTADHPGVARCLELKHQAISALVDCIAHHNQTYASIVRCQQMPDQLPF